MVWSLFALSVFAALSHLSQGERQGWQEVRDFFDKLRKIFAGEDIYKAGEYRYNIYCM